MQNFRQGQGSYVLGKLMNTYYVYTARLSLAFNESSALEHFECGKAIEIRNGIMFISTWDCHIYRDDSYTNQPTQTHTPNGGCIDPTKLLGLSKIHL